MGLLYLYTHNGNSTSKDAVPSLGTTHQGTLNDNTNAKCKRANNLKK
jgi:hypothetical protein